MQDRPAFSLDDARRAAVRMTDAAAGGGVAASGLKSFVGLNLFYWHLDAFERDENPLPAFIAFCDDARGLFDAGLSLARHTEFQLAGEKPRDGDTGHLGALYSAVYSRMDDAEYFDHSRDVLRARLEANDIDPAELFGGKVIVDAGCGGGKFTHAIAGFDPREVIGVDIGEGNVSFAKAQAEKRKQSCMPDYRVGSVLELPVSDAYADLVWCNSVGHLTGDQGACLRELARVLKPGGQLYYYVNGRFGLFEIMLETLQVLMADVPQNVLQHQLELMGVGAGRISWIMACLFAPYEFVPKAEVDEMMARAGLKVDRLLGRGIDIDFSEKIARGEPYADIKYGEGQLKYLATRM